MSKQDQKYGRIDWDFDLELLLSLNEEYRDKRLVPQAPAYEAEDIVSRGQKRAEQLNKQFNVAGKRVLEIGCGMGETAYTLASEYGCEVYGVDLDVERSFGMADSNHTSWLDGRKHPNLTLRDLDIAKEDYSHLGKFDLIYSFTVWEHMMHPFSALKAAKHLLKRNGYKFLITNLYRGPKASHLYREIYFPWPHLLFQDSVFREFYDTKHPDAYVKALPYVNKLTASQYLSYFDILGFHVEDISYRSTPIDEDFVQRFHYEMSRYPRFDLERDFMHVTLTHSGLARFSSAVARRKIAKTRKNLVQMKSAFRKKLASVETLRRIYHRVRRNDNSGGDQ